LELRFTGTERALRTMLSYRGGLRLGGGGDGLVFGMGDVHATVLADGDEVSMGYYGLLQVTMTYYDLP